MLGLAEQLSPPPVIEDEAPVWVPDPENIPQQLAYICPADELFYGGAAGGGKALDVDTELPTPNGWIKMGAVRIGDSVFDERGHPCRVLAVSPVLHERPCYRLKFDDGESIVADAEHRWLTFDMAERLSLLHYSPEWRANRRAKRVQRGTGKRPDLAKRNAINVRPLNPLPSGSIRTTQEIFNSLTQRGRTNYSIPLALAFQLPDIYLPIAPYVLGAWLGDGKTVAGKIYVHPNDSEILEQIKRAGVQVRNVPCEPLGWTLLGIQPTLRKIGVLGNKHIPAIYLRASIEQRLELMRGLMDTDGTCDVDGGAEYTTISLKLAEGVLELAKTLGVKATLIEGRAKLNGRDCGPKYRIKITTNLRLFNLSRKAQRQKQTVRQTQRHRYITSCERVESRPVRCIAVDSPSRLYLAGRSMTPTHNSDLLLGLAGTQHRSSLILRREFPPMRALIERSREIFNRAGADRGKDSYNESLHIWRLRTGRIIEFGSLQHEKDKEDYRGRPHDGKFWDELPQFSKTQYEFVNLWNRTTVPGQRTRIVSAGNAPMTLAGRWIIERWAAWLNKKHGRPAKSGEVRWYVTVDGQDVETPNSQPIEHKDANGKVLTLTPTSRCFIKAQLKDNKYLRGTAYEARLQSTPEPMRSMLLEGLFDVEFEGNAFQVIPTRWVLEAMERWRKGPKPSRPLDVLGADIARGGDDKMVLAPKRGHWYDALIKYPGHMVQDGPVGANYILLAIAGEGQPVISVDGIGIGSSVFDSLMQRNTPKVFSQIFSEGADGRRDKTGRLEFLNLRAWAYWNLREALDPSNGHNLCLPDDDELLADLTTPLWSQMPTGKIKVESKEDIKKRLGRSTDCGDAVVLAEIIAPQSSAEDWLKAWAKKDEKR